MILTLTDEGSNAGSCLVHERGGLGSGWALNYKDNTIRKGCIGKIFINQSGCLRCPPETPTHTECSASLAAFTPG